MGGAHELSDPPREARIRATGTNIAPGNVGRCCGQSALVDRATGGREPVAAVGAQRWLRRALRHGVNLAEQGHELSSLFVGELYASRGRAHLCLRVLNAADDRPGQSVEAHRREH